MSLGRLALRCLLSLCSGDAKGGLGRRCVFFGDSCVSAVWILQSVAEGINRLSLQPPLLQGLACSQRRFCD